MFTRALLNVVSIFIVVLMSFPLSVRASDRLMDTKTTGKLSMIAILSLTAIIFKILVNRDQREANDIHNRLGLPDKVMEFQQGFDHWRIEWYDERIYTFRNGTLVKDNK